MKESNKKHFYVQTGKSLWVLRGSFRRMKHKEKEYTLIIVPKRRTLPKIPTMQWYRKYSIIKIIVSRHIQQLRSIHKTNSCIVILQRFKVVPFDLKAIKYTIRSAMNQRILRMFGIYDP